MVPPGLGRAPLSGGTVGLHRYDMDITDTVAVVKALRDAATTALAKPSILNTQPWLWPSGAPGARLALRAAPSGATNRRRPERSADDLSCGVASHHAQAALAAAGFAAVVELIPEPGDADLLARITRPQPTRRPRLTWVPRSGSGTDRRPYTAQPVSDQSTAG
jgi:hypothetical protein